jgi:hypothetical protein
MPTTDETNDMQVGDVIRRGELQVSNRRASWRSG